VADIKRLCCYAERTANWPEVGHHLTVMMMMTMMTTTTTDSASFDACHLYITSRSEGKGDSHCVTCDPGVRDDNYCEDTGSVFGSIVYIHHRGRTNRNILENSFNYKAVDTAHYLRRRD